MDETLTPEQIAEQERIKAEQEGQPAGE
jgi:hypothetical protein